MTTKPSIAQRVRAALYAFRNGIAVKKSPYIWREQDIDRPTWQITDYDAYLSEGFLVNSVIYAAVMYKARALAAVPVRAYAGSHDAPEPLPADHPLSKVIARPNRSQSWAEFAMTQEIYLNLHGNAYTLVRRGNTEVGRCPVELWPLRPDRVYIVPGKRGEIKGFWYTPAGKGMSDGVPLLPEDVAHVKYPNPADEFEGQGYGLTPISAAAHSVDVDNQITKFLKLFFDRGAVTQGVLSFDTALTDDEINRARQRWMEIYGGVENWTEIAILDNGGKYQRLGLDFSQMGFQVLDERTEARILSVLGVPPILIGSRTGLLRSTYSNYEQARLSFWEDTMAPEVAIWEDDLSYYLQSEDGGFVRFELGRVPALRKAQYAQVATWAALIQNGIPINDATEFVGLSLPKLPPEIGDVSSLALQPPAAQPAPAAPAPEPTATEEPEVEKEPEAEEQALAEEELKRLIAELEQKPVPPAAMTKQLQQAEENLRAALKLLEL